MSQVILFYKALTILFLWAFAIGEIMLFVAAPPLAHIDAVHKVFFGSLILFIINSTILKKYPIS